MTTSPQPSLPWYRFFWPWFIVILLGTVVIAGISTVVLAFQKQDSLVRDEWYADGTAINRRFEHEAEARRRSIRVELTTDVRTGSLWLEIEGDDVDGISGFSLELSHPTHAARDRSFLFVRTPEGRFRSALDGPEIAGRWYASLEPVLDPGADGGVRWRLTQSITMPVEGHGALVLGGGG